MSKAKQVLETKTASDPESFEEFTRTFYEYKATNDIRLGDIEKGKSVDVLTTDKMQRLDIEVDARKRAMDRLELKQARPALDGGVRQVSSPEHKNAFETYVRRGDESALRVIETKAHTIGSASDGGYLVPEELETQIGARLAQISPIRGIASVRQVSGSVLKKPYSIKGPSVGWVSETDIRPQTEGSKLAELQFPTMELYAMPAATSSLLDDSAVDVEQWISTEVETAFAEQEGKAFISGDGINKPRGFLTYDVVAESAWAWGKLGSLSTGVAGKFPAADASDILLDTIYALKAGYRQNANWVMNRKTQAEIRKLKDRDGNYLWTPPATPGAQASLLGFGLVEAEDMPDIADKATPIAFGDFARGYLVVDRTGVRVLRDPYSAKPYVLFYTTKRIGGGVQDFDAIKLLKFAA
jgi:HK97 family phage major capsid protein